MRDEVCLDSQTEQGAKKKAFVGPLARSLPQNFPLGFPPSFFRESSLPNVDLFF